MPIELSILLPTYNGSKFICAQIESILGQTFDDFELLISDDASTDHTCEILDSYSQKDSRVKIVKQTRNLGFKRNFEYLIKNSMGRYVALADQDDIWSPNHLQLLLENIGSSLIACGNSELVDCNGRSIGKSMKDASGIDFIPEDIESQLHHLMYNNFVQGCTMIMSKDLIELALPIPADVRFHDYWLAMVSALSTPIVYIDQNIVKYRQHTENVIGSESSLFRKIFTRGKPESQIVCESLIERFGSNLTNSQINQLQEAIRHHKSRYSLLPGLYCAFNTYHKYEIIYWTKSRKLKILRLLKALIGL